MRTFSFGALALVLVAACSGSISNSDGGVIIDDASNDTKKGPCDGLGCASGPGKLLVTVKDDMTMTGLGPVFFDENGTNVMWSSCQANQQMQCTGTYIFQNLAIGAHQLTAHAAGHAPKTFTAQVLGPTGCCGLGPDSNVTVLVTAVDAAMLCTATGGTVQTVPCYCNGTADFPDTCGTGACSCSPTGNPNMIKQCACPSMQCFDPEIGCKKRN